MILQLWSGIINIADFKALKRVFGLQTKIWQNAPEWPGETTDKVSSWSDVGDDGSCPTLLPPEKKIDLLISSSESICIFQKMLFFMFKS